MKIVGENKFYVPTQSFSIGGEHGGYTLAYSADGVHFTDFEKSVPANETLVVNGVCKNMCFKLKGNEGELYLQY